MAGRRRRQAAPPVTRRTSASTATSMHRSSRRSGRPCRRLAGPERDVSPGTLRSAVPAGDGRRPDRRHSHRVAVCSHGLRRVCAAGYGRCRRPLPRALLYLHLQGDTLSALRLADSILAANPDHLFGFLIQGTAAQLAGNQRLLQRAWDALVASWDREMKVGRSEYRDHQPMLDRFRAAALASRSARP